MSKHEHVILFPLLQACLFSLQCKIRPQTQTWKSSIYNFKDVLKVWIARRKKKMFTCQGLGSPHPLTHQNYRCVLSRLPPKTPSEKGFVRIKEEDFLTLRMSEAHGMKVVKRDCLAFREGRCVLTFCREDDIVINDESSKERYLKVMLIRNIWEILLCLYVIKHFFRKYFFS